MEPGEDISDVPVPMAALALPVMEEQEIRPLVLLCYTWHDPLDDLPDEISLRMDEDAVSILTLDQQEVLKSFPWPVIGEFEGKLISDDPEEMEMFMFDVKDIGRFAIQCDDFSVLTKRFALIRDRENADRNEQLEMVNVRRDSCMVIPAAEDMGTKEGDKGRISTIEAIHSQIVLCYTWKDPLGELPDEVGLQPLPSSLLMMSTAKQGRSVTTLKIIQWVRIVSFSGRKITENPEDMEEFTFEVEEVGKYTLQCENYSLLQRMFAEAKNGSSTVQIQKLLVEAGSKSRPPREAVRAERISWCPKPPMVQFGMTKAESFAAHQEAEDEWGSAAPSAELENDMAQLAAMMSASMPLEVDDAAADRWY